MDQINRAEKKHQAVGHFNIGNLEMLKGVFAAACRLSLPVVIGLSEGERKFVGDRQAAALVKCFREEYGHPIYLNADHTKTIAGVREAVEAGFDAVIFDGSELTIEENIKYTKEAVELAKGLNDRVVIEGEIGYIGRSSTVFDEIPENALVGKDELVTAEEASRFVKATGVDLLAPAVGNVHGMLAGAENPDLDIERVAEIREACGVPLVLHGGSGIKHSDMKEAIAAGMPLVHVSTELRVAYRQALEEVLMNNKKELAPYRLLTPAVDAVTEVALKSFELFNRETEDQV